MPGGIFQVDLQSALAKRCAHGQCFGVHLYAQNLAALAVQNACNSARACAKLKHSLARRYHAGQTCCGTATVGVNFVRVAMFYH